VQPGSPMRQPHASTLPVEDPRRVDRVRDRTPAHVIARIDRRTAARVFRVARQGPEAILARIDGLDREWDIDRYLALNFAVVSTLASYRTRRGGGWAWRALLRAQQAFLGMHAIAGWSPPTSLLRRLGVRTQKEIDAERAVLAELYHLLAEPLGAETEVIEEVTYVAETVPDNGQPARW
jgi:hypothetical protein